MSSHTQRPPFDLIILTALPRATWVGRAVFHPMSQDGGEPEWVVDGALRYDVGVVSELFEGDLADEDFEDLRVRLVTDSGGSLVYAPCMLWTPRLAGE